MTKSMILYTNIYFFFLTMVTILNLPARQNKIRIF